MQDSLTIQIGVVSASLLPLSLIVVYIATKLFSKYHAHLGQTTVIITSINGILTKNHDAAKAIIFDKYEADIDEESDLIYLQDNEKKDEIRVQKKHLPKNLSFKLMATVTTLCHYAKIHKFEDLIAKFFKNCALSTAQIHRDYEIISQIPTSKEKKISTVVAKNFETKEIFAFSKGNPYKLLEKCKRLLIDEKKIDLTPKLLHKLKKRVKKLNENGQKVIAFAYKGLPFKQLDNYPENFVENDLVLIGFIGLGDSLNESAIPVIEKIKEMGIKTYILSKSKVRKAMAVAQISKAINPHYFETLTHEDLKDLSEEKLQKMFSNKEKDFVFAEIKTEDKDKIISALKKNNEVIAVASLKNKLDHLVKGIEKDNYSKKNRAKIVTHALSCKIAELMLILAAIIFKAPIALSISLIILLDLIINLILELALQTEKSPEPNKSLKNHLIFNGIVMGIILSGIYFWNLIRFGWYPGEIFPQDSFAIVQSTSIAFVLLATMQIINAHLLRDNKQSVFKNSIFKNPYLALTSILSFLIIYTLLTFPSLQNFFQTQTVALTDLWVILFSALLILIVEEIRKFLIRKNEIPQDKSNPEKQ